MKSRSRSWTILALSAALTMSAACTDEVDDDAPMGDEDPVGDSEPTDPTLGPLPTEDTVEAVDVAAYVGLWFEQSSIPQGFQRSCTGTTATYAPIADDQVSVLNRCFVDSLDGEEVSIEGTATIVDPSNAKLEVSFGFGTSPYWIVDLGVPTADGEPYPWAAVSTPGRESLWILSREPVMAADRFEAIVERLERRGFDPARMTMTEQAN